MSSSAGEEIKRQLAQHPVESKLERRVIIANAVANQARPPFRDDVRSRKLTIATGTGRVHGEMFVLRSWGLAALPLRA